ncbi:FAD-binding domain-containing protein [uncultured Tateyamaria sp.]|uniref:FAD-binding domain-containing protein n=1 Tax=uncultured Tateyamaria sp. TaxID=455651 RepID=UPI002609FDDB|nr:FAD-binding domain-containing protein [uncultured Tateyamaria sp.]
MTVALETFPPTRTKALDRLRRFVPAAGRDYAARRNYDLGPGQHSGVSTLSPYLRARLITEEEVLRSVLGRHSASAAEKFIQEVYWRTYWKGWLEMRPQVWTMYRASLSSALNEVQTQAGLRARWEDACRGETEIDCFNTWAQELVQTGYLHNHARMWFASIWIFTLRLPWELGADFFLRHLLDGDPASNTLSWRWVAGIQTVGKTYLARPDNIAKYTQNRFPHPTGLAQVAEPLPAQPMPEPQPLPLSGTVPANGVTGLLLHDEDTSPGFVLDQGLDVKATACVTVRSDLSPLAIAPHVDEFATGALADATARYGARLGAVSDVTAKAEAIAHWAQGLDQIVTAYAPVGPVASLLSALRARDDVPPVIEVQRPYDRAAWPHATRGFFKFKARIPDLISEYVP